MYLLITQRTKVTVPDQTEMLWSYARCPGSTCHTQVGKETGYQSSPLEFCEHFEKIFITNEKSCCLHDSSQVEVSLKRIQLFEQTSNTLYQSFVMFFTQRIVSYIEYFLSLYLVFFNGGSL